MIAPELLLAAGATIAELLALAAERVSSLPPPVDSERGTWAPPARGAR